MKNFVNFHVLISHSPSCLNRDDMNMQKSAVFGGVRRVRISSQSLKRAMRKSEYYQHNFGASSIRSRDLSLLKDEFLAQLKDEFDESIIVEALERFAKTKSNDEQEDEGEKGSTKKIAVAPWITEEFEVICQIVKDVRQEGLTPEEEEKATKDFEKQKSKKKKPLEHFTDIAFDKKIEKRLKENKDALTAAIGSAMDVAFAGRMATSGLMTSIDGALAMAHPLTTHAVDSDIDWFTAVDDLQEQGSGHLDTQEFSSGVFYRYASLNISQLQENLGGATREEVLKIAAHVVQMLATVVPSAKQQTFAAHNLADLVMVSFSDIPVSLVNAFEKPVQQKNFSGFRDPSIVALHEYWDKVHAGYGLDERCAQFSLTNVIPDKEIVRQESLEKLKKWVSNNGKE